MRIIELKHGYQVFVDNEDYHRVTTFGGWYVDGRGYAISDKMVNGKRMIIDLHRFIRTPSEGFVTDHINQNKLDNRKSNLRDATKSLNALNSKIPTTNTSGFKGVSWSKVGKKWRSALWLNGKQLHLGYFDTAQEAHGAYQDKLSEVL
jgi:hypothetical protein